MNAASVGAVPEVPHVCVLMATHNGAPWLEVQIDSVLAQTGVSVRLVISDDASTDGTADLLRSRAAADRRIAVIEHDRRFGSAARHFYFLLEHAPRDPGLLYALADQDDIWHADKLQRHADILRRTGVQAVSSDVTAFWPNGRSVKIRKSFAQKRWDYLLEPPGPGCTFLMRAEVVERCRSVLDALAASGREPLPYHDWMIYLVARASGMRWSIDAWPSLLYRQHDRNEVGAHVGWRATRHRLRRLASGEYAGLVRQAIAIALMCEHRPGAAAPHLRTLDLLLHGRRRWRDAVIATLSMPRGVGVVGRREHDRPEVP